jgi:glutamate-1-semialdehyde 2,1-aminomutase
MVPGVEMVRMVNSGTEATMSAIRVARGYTGREKIIKFDGCYHGHGDSFLIAAGSGAATLGVPDSPGVTEGTAKDTLTAIYNDLNSVSAFFDQDPDDIAAVIVEPVAGNMGCVPPLEGFLEGLQGLCKAKGALLIFDEVMTGFRLAKGGAQELFGIRADLVTLGKIIGGGLPVGAYGGRAEIMKSVAPAGKVYQAGTLSGNPIAMASGLATLRYLHDNPSTYSYLESVGAEIEEGMGAIHARLGLKVTIQRVGSMMTLFFNQEPVHNFTEAARSNLEQFKAYFNLMLGHGVYFPPSQYEALFLSKAVAAGEISTILHAHEQSLTSMLHDGLISE